MFITQDEAERRIASEQSFRDVLQTDARTAPLTQEPVIPEVVVDPPNWHIPGRETRPHRNIEDKALIGLDALLLGPREAAKIHGTATATADHYSRGELSNGEESAALKAEIEEKKRQVRDRAFDRLMQTLANVTDEKLADEDLTAPDLARVASDLSRVTEKMMPIGMGEDKPRATFIIMQPPAREETTYPQITVGQSRA